MNERRSEYFYTKSGRRVLGYECPPHDDYWWVPEEGASMAVGYSLFRNKREALEAGCQSLRQQQAQIEAALVRNAQELAAL